jgi:hypothetical protein
MKLDKAIALAKDFFTQRGFTYKFFIHLRDSSWWLKLELQRWDVCGWVLYDVEFERNSPDSLSDALLIWIKDVFGFDVGGCQGIH